jgi:signal transduction histidine kinase
VGHEITGALLALQTAANLYEIGDNRAGNILSQTVARLESALVTLRETVYNLRPTTTAKSNLELLCNAFNFCEVELITNISDELGHFKHAEILVSNLKEALTNVSKHSNATIVSVRIDENADYVRMTVSDNGQSLAIYRFGMGLSGMKERIRTAGGTLTVNNTESGFKLTCVLPKDSCNESNAEIGGKA